MELAADTLVGLLVEHLWCYGTVVVNGVLVELGLVEALVRDDLLGAALAWARFI